MDGHATQKGSQGQSSPRRASRYSLQARGAYLFPRNEHMSLHEDTFLKVLWDGNTPVIAIGCGLADLQDTTQGAPLALNRAGIVKAIRGGYWIARHSTGLGRKCAEY